MTNEEPKSITNEDGTRRVFIYKQRDGFWRWRQEELLPPDPDLGHPEAEWDSFSPSGLFASAADAEREALF